MTVVGDEIVLNCRACYCSHGYGLRLQKHGDHMVCPHDASHRYVVESGYLRKV